jgi:hypothetical protein
MLTLLCFLLVLIAILMAIRLLPLLFMAAGLFWLWHSHTWVLVLAIVIGAALGIVRAVRYTQESIG